MDFVISKVAMSIAALTVVSILGGMFGQGIFPDKNNELESVLTDLSIAVDRAARSGSEGAVEWRVPFLSTGDRVTISIDDDLLRAASGDRTAVMESMSQTHAWIWDGGGLNKSAVMELDRSSPPVSSNSGQVIRISTRMVMFENKQELFVFVSANT